jgi:RES domain-containing protein
MVDYRLSRKKFTNHLSGVGASIYGARWNPSGVEIVYTAESRALALAGIAVHLSVGMVPDDYILLTIELPDHLIVYEPDLDALSDGWDEFPYNIDTQIFGRDFVSRGDACVMKVPSSVVKSDYNYLINPYHPKFKEVTIRQVKDFRIDRRLL